MISPRLKGALAGALLLLSLSVQAQMPGWKVIHDRDGNTYFVDQIGRIYTSGKPEFQYRPVSAEGLVYYLNQGRELCRRGYPVQGLTLLKSILALNDTSSRVRKSREEAARFINEMKQRHGTRFTAWDDEASLLITREEGVITLTQERMRYAIRIPAEANVLRVKRRSDIRYSYHGMRIGVRAGGTGDGFDLLLAVDSERFPSRIRGMGQLVENWEYNLGPRGYVLTELENTPDRRVYRFDSGGDGGYGGYEGIFLNGSIGYFMRILTPAARREGHDKLMLRIFRSFTFVPLSGEAGRAGGDDFHLR